MKALCKHCKQEFELLPAKTSRGLPEFPLHKTPGSHYACEGQQKNISSAGDREDPNVAKYLTERFSKKRTFARVRMDYPGKINDEIEKKFEKFHNKNPHVYKLLVKYAREARKTGKKKFGMGAIYERARWNVEVETRGVPFKIDNDFRSRYSRVIMHNEHDLDGFFELRELRPREVKRSGNVIRTRF